MIDRGTALALVGSACLALSACSSPTASERSAALGDSASVDFATWQVQPGAEPLPNHEARGDRGRILLQGSIMTPVPCYDVEGSVTLSGRELTLEVIAARRDVVCIQVVAFFGYEARVEDLPSGTYRVRIVHRLDGRAFDVLEADVEVE